MLFLYHFLIFLWLLVRIYQKMSNFIHYFCYFYNNNVEISKSGVEISFAFFFFLIYIKFVFVKDDFQVF